MVLPRAHHNGPQVHTDLEEVIHAATHGLGILLAIAALVFLVVKAASLGSSAPIWAVAIYGASSTLLYAASTVYHASFKLTIQPLLEVFDHAAIYLKIAGSYTPFAMLTLPTGSGAVVLSVVWAIAVLGVAAKFLAHFTGQAAEKWDKLSLASYIGMGWIAIFVASDLVKGLSWSGFSWLLAGGLCFTVGALFYAWRSRRYTHAIFHVFVLAGSVCHFVAIYGFVLSRATASA